MCCDLCDHYINCDEVDVMSSNCCLKCGEYNACSGEGTVPASYGEEEDFEDFDDEIDEDDDLDDDDYDDDDYDEDDDEDDDEEDDFEDDFDDEELT